MDNSPFLTVENNRIVAKETTVATTYDEMETAIGQARAVMLKAESFIKTGVRWAQGRLRLLDLDAPTLRALKAELKGYDSKRGCWK